MSRKLTDEDIQGALDRHPEYRLKPRTTLSTLNKTCCPIGIICLDQGITDPSLSAIDVDSFFGTGVIEGFDGYPLGSLRDEANRLNYAEGFALGQRWRAKALQGQTT